MKKLLLYLSMLLMAFVCNVMPVNAQVIELLKDIRVGSSGSATYNYMSKANGKIFMMADDGIHGMELWVSDGTEAGTQLLKDIRPGSASSEAGWRNNFATANNKLFFIANDGVHGAELWATDGTQAGTYMVKNIFPGSGGGLGGYGSPDQLYAYNGKVYFAAQDQDPYFDPESHGIELWCSDGTEEGTYMVKDIRPNDPTNYGTSGSTPQRFQEFNGLLYFVAYDGAQGVNGGHGGELWVTDGTEEGTHLVKDIAQEGYSETPMYLTPCGDKMYFRTQTGEFGLELWATDGTEAGTYLVKDIFPGDAAPGLPNPSYPKYLTCLNGTLYFRANSYVQGDEVIGDLWKSDGTEEGTINLSVDEGIHGIVNVKAFGDMVIFLGYEGSNYNNWELYGWSEARGAHLIKEINPDPTVGIDGNPEQNFPAGFVEYKNKLYFQAAAVTGRVFLWETDGTEEGTIRTPGQENSVTSGSLVGGSEFTFIVSYGSLFYPARYNFFGSTGKEVHKLTVAPIDVYAVIGGGDYCQSDEGLHVGLSGSEEGVTYTLFKNGVAQTPTIEGTGEAISFGTQPAGTYTIVGSNVAGSLDMEGSAIVNAVSSITVSVSIVADNENVCTGETVTFMANPVNGGASPYYQWYVNGQEMGEQPTYTYFSWIPGDYEVYAKLTSSYSCAANVAESNIITLAIKGFVTPEVSISASENPVYSPEPVSFTPTPVFGGELPSFKWFVNNVLVSTAEIYEYLPINEDQVYVVMTSSENCVTASTAHSNVIEMIVNNGIPAAYTVTGGGNYCEGSGGLPVGLSDSEIGVLYTLYKNAVAQSSTIEGTGEAISFGNQFEGVYTITGTNANTTTTMAGNAVIVELENLLVSVTIEPDHEPICTGTSITFYAYPVNAGNNPTYQWFRNGTAVLGNNFNTYSFVPAIGDEVYVVVISSLTCTTNNPATSEVYELNVLPMVLAEVSLVVDNNNVCEGTWVTFTATPVNGGDNPSYYWWLNDLSVGANKPTFTYVPSHWDMVKVVMVSDSNLPCVGNSAGAESNIIKMIVNVVVTPSVTITASGNPVFVGNPVTIIPSPVNGGDTPTYQWFVNGAYASDESSFTYTPANGDHVYVKMASSLECVTAELVVSNTIEMIVLTDYPNVAINPTSMVQNINIPNGQATELVQINNSGLGALYWNASIEYLSKNEVKLVPEGPVSNGTQISLSKGNSNRLNAIEDKNRGETVVLHYDGDNNDAIGLSLGGTFQVAARYPSSMTAPYTGYELQSVDVYINNVPTSVALKIWDAGTTTTPGALLHQQSFSGTGWLTIELSNPLVLSGSDIWIGYTVTHTGGTHPAGCDAGPANTNGDWISSDGISWDHLSDFGISSNWNIRANLYDNSYSWLSINPTSGIVDGNTTANIEVHFDATGLENQIYTANIKFSSNDPATPLLTIPVIMSITVDVEENELSGIEVYPNPTSGMLYIKIPTGINVIKMYNQFGQEIKSENVAGQTSLNWNLGTMPGGTYLLRFVNDKGMILNKRIIIM